MPKVKLKGLNIRRNSTGKWYVSLRASGSKLITGFDGTRDDLDREMEREEFLDAYIAARRRGKRITYPQGTLGALIDWYETREAWTGLRPRTQSDYKKARLFLERVFSYNYREITSEDVIEMRDRAAEKHYKKFSNDVVAYLSAVFREAKDAKLVAANPSLGIKRLYKAGKDANRRWKDGEWEKAFAMAPAHLRAPLAIARWAGLRGQDIAVLTWGSYRNDRELGKALVFTPLKNGEQVGEISIGVRDELRAVLDPLSVDTLPSAPICRNSLGVKYPSDNALRKVWQDFKQSKEFKAVLPDSSDLTLHGLRVTYASELREAGFSDREVADMLGDLSESMGKKYSRGAEMRKTSVRVQRKWSAS